MTGLLNPFGAPEPLPILNPSNFVPKNGFPVVKGLTHLNPKSSEIGIFFFQDDFRCVPRPWDFPSPGGSWQFYFSSNKFFWGQDEWKTRATIEVAIFGYYCNFLNDGAP